MAEYEDTIGGSSGYVEGIRSLSKLDTSGYVSLDSELSTTKVPKLVSKSGKGFKAESQWKEYIYIEDSLDMGDTIFFKSRTWMAEGRIKLGITYKEPSEKPKKYHKDECTFQLMRTPTRYRVDLEEDKMKIFRLSDDGHAHLDKTFPLKKSKMPCWLFFMLRCGHVSMLSGETQSSRESGFGSDSEAPPIPARAVQSQVRTSGPLDKFQQIKRELKEDAERSILEIRVLTQERITVENSMARKEARRISLTDEIHQLHVDLNQEAQTLRNINKLIEERKNDYGLIQQELAIEAPSTNVSVGIRPTMTETNVQQEVLDPQVSKLDDSKPPRRWNPISPTTFKQELDNLIGGSKTQRIKLLSEKEVNKVAQRLLPLQGITFVGANDQGGLLVLIEAAFKASTEPIVRALAGGLHCTIEAVNGFCLHGLKRGSALEGLSRTVGFVAKAGDTPVLLTAAHNLERTLSCSHSIDRSVVDTKTEKMVEYFNYYGTDFEQGACGETDDVVGVGVISTCKRKCNEEPAFSTNRQNFSTHKRRYSTGEVDELLQTCRNRNCNTASDLAVLKLDRYVKTNPENGLAPALEIIEDPAVLFASHLYKMGSATGLTYGRVKSVNGTLNLGDLPGVSYRNVLLIEPIGGSRTFSEPGDSGSGVLIDVKTHEGVKKRHAAAIVLGGENSSPGMEKPPYGLCIMLKDSMDALACHPDPNVNGLRVEDIRILEASLLTQDENNNNL